VLFNNDHNHSDYSNDFHSLLIKKSETQTALNIYSVCQNIKRNCTI